MLPTYPKIEEFRRTANSQEIERLATERVPILSMISRHIQFEGNQSTILRHDNSVGHTPMHQVSGEIRIAKMPMADFDAQKLHGILQGAAEQLAEGMSAQFFAEIDRSTAEVGNVVDGGGQPLSEDMILKVLSKMQLSFEPDGTWNPPTIVASPLAVEKLMQGANSDGSGSAEFNKALGQLLEEKRNDHRRREADRVLAG